ncbi:hypothetical protein ACFL1X_13915, partial [Candidatus Hydrogenedentota bacterium]
GLIVTLLLFMFFFFDPVSGLLYPLDKMIEGAPIPIHIVATVLIMSAVALPLGAKILFTKRDLRPVTRFLNTVAACAFAMPAMSLSYRAVMTSSETISVANQQDAAGPSVQVRKKNTDKPDIYFIVLDGCARADVFEEIYDGDNSEFYDFLEDNGFFVAENGRANYCQTYLSLASTMNMTHLTDLAKKMGAKSTNRSPLKKMVHDSKLVELLKQEGYEFVAFASGYAGTSIESADVYLEPDESTSEFQEILSRAVPIPGISKPKGGYDRHRVRVLYTLDKLKGIPESDKPQFVFAHILSPHPPFVFAADGKPIRPNWKYGLFDGTTYMRYGTHEKYLRQYREQMLFITGKLRESLESIIAHSPDAVIIIQGDHGPGAELNWKSTAKTNVWERMSILNACRIPDGGNELLYPEITSANTFRVVLNHLFETKYELLEDRSYFSVFAHPYMLKDVTNRAVKMERRLPAEKQE